MIRVFLFLNIIFLFSPNYAEPQKNSTGESITYGSPLSLFDYMLNIPNYIVSGRIIDHHQTLFFKFKSNNKDYLCATTLPDEASIEEVIIKKTKNGNHYLNIRFFLKKKGLRVGKSYHRIFDEEIVKKYTNLKSKKQESFIYGKENND